MRQQINWALALPPEVASGMDPATRALFGLSGMGNTRMGEIDQPSGGRLSARAGGNRYGANFPRWRRPTVMSNEGKMQIFRRPEAKGLMEFMTLAEMSAEQMGGLKAMVEAGYADGEEVRVLVAIPGFSLTHAWLKKDYPLLLHSHSSDCLYHITAGSLQMGSETMVAGDSFFVPAGSAYTYRPGPDGVEVLEFRHESPLRFSQPHQERRLLSEGRSRDRCGPRPLAQGGEAICGGGCACGIVRGAGLAMREVVGPPFVWGCPVGQARAGPEITLNARIAWPRELSPPEETPDG